MMNHRIHTLDGLVCPFQDAAGIRNWLQSLLHNQHLPAPDAILLQVNRLPQTGAWLLNQLKTAELNDQLRHSLPFPSSRLGQVCCTQGFASLEQAERFIEAIRQMKDFSADNDPYLEHDFGQVEIDGVAVFWKIDYYAPDSEQGSDTPWDAEATRRIIMLMLMEEY
ncbi:DUF3768 domain-containing protein [Chromobacterium sp. TRC.1.1.SA]|uniref:DUF3768 domain-containing protein n=1 Tax=Chromobacterium indicum TaxID=3110228 RepID=A0ABV0CQZ3_9NEIS